MSEFNPKAIKKASRYLHKQFDKLTQLDAVNQEIESIEHKNTSSSLFKKLWDKLSIKG